MTANILTTDEARDVEHIDLIVDDVVAGLVSNQVFVLEGDPTHVMATLRDENDVGHDVFTIDPERFATERGVATIIDIYDHFASVNLV